MKNISWRAVRDSYMEMHYKSNMRMHSSAFVVLI